LHVVINNPDGHIQATKWMTCAIILHNLLVEVEGGVTTSYFQPLHGQNQEEEDAGGEEDAGEEEDEDNAEDEDGNPGSVKRKQLIAELLAHCQALGITL
jgi:hypothetical protein